MEMTIYLHLPGFELGAVCSYGFSRGEVRVVACTLSRQVAGQDPLSPRGSRKLR